MDSLNDILLHKDFDEPEEVTAIKSFAQRTFKANVKVQIQPNAIIITAKSAALANSLRFHIPQLQKEAATTKRLVFRIGQ
jgi:hypothetical protein